MSLFTLIKKASTERKVLDYMASLNSELHNAVEEGWAYKEQKQLLDLAIDRLPPQRKQIYTLCKIEGRSYAEVSQLLGISTSTISDHIVKATRFIKEQHQLSNGAALLALLAVFHKI